MKSNAAAYKTLDSWTQKISHYGTDMSMVYYILLFTYRGLIAASVGEKVYGSEGMKCDTDEPGCENLCFDEYASPSMFRLWAYQILGVVAPMVLFYAYEQYCQQKAMQEDDKVKEEEEEEEKEFNRLKELGQVQGDFVPQVRQRKYNYKTKYLGQKKETIVSNNWLRWAFIAQLVVRLGIEIFFVYYKNSLYNFEMHRPEHGPWVGRPNYYINMDVPGSYLCGKDASRRSEGVAQACQKTIQSNEYSLCFIEFYKEKTYYVRFMNVVDLVCIFVTFVDIFLCLKRMYLHKKLSNKLAGPQYNFDDENGDVFPNCEMIEMPMMPMDNFHDNRSFHDNNGYQVHQVPNYHGSQHGRASTRC